jgi:hypothetical protein
MTKTTRRSTILGCVGCALAATAAALAIALAPGRTIRAEEQKGPDVELARTRSQVKMLDTLYKNAVVSITKTYDGPPAAKVAKQVFSAMEKDGWHSARLVDASGSPQNEANNPSSPFEKKAAEAMRSGKTYYEEVSGTGANRRLYAATVVPAVMKKCATCHGVKEGELLGFIRYDLPVK